MEIDKDSNNAWEYFKKISQEPLNGSNSQWDQKLEEKEYKDGCKFNIWHRKNQGVVKSIYRTDISLKGIDIDAFTQEMLINSNFSENQS